MSYAGRMIQDGDVESLIRKYLQAGVMEDGRYEKTNLGTPQGGNLSPLLSNVMLNEVDKELEKRGLNLTRYADDRVIAVKSEFSSIRGMHSVTGWIGKKLGLKVNATKTHVTTPSKLKYLGYDFYKDPSVKRWEARPHQDSKDKFKAKLKLLCCRSWSIDFTTKVRKLNEVIRGWISYFIIGKMKTVLIGIDEHLRTMLRVVIWKQWKVSSKREWGLKKLGIGKDLARCTAYCGNRYYWVATKTCLSRAVSKAILTRRGLVSCVDYYADRRHTLQLG